jgi:hypothetical protein
MTGTLIEGGPASNGFGDIPALQRRQDFVAIIVTGPSFGGGDL